MSDRRFIKMMLACFGVVIGGTAAILLLIAGVMKVLQ